MNNELQAQSDVLVKAISHLETTIHQDIILATFTLGVLLALLIVIILLSKP